MCMIKIDNIISSSVAKVGMVGHRPNQSVSVSNQLDAKKFDIL